jgi:hypothetical protein
MERRLCPKCGAYWRCDCVLDELNLPATPGCVHDWADAVGVDLDDTVTPGRVMVCRLCGLYTVSAESG